MEGIYMSTKTAPILDQTHTLIVNKQSELKKKHRIKMKISDIIDVIITKNINMLEKYMGLNVEKEKPVNPENKESVTEVPVPSVTSQVENDST
jgi:hypothetical protein